MMQLTNYFIWFMTYSFIGWIYESTICSIPKHHKFINRGYLHGPYCPIYGAGAVINLILLKNVESPIVIFIIAMVTSSIIEYVTSYVMEKVFLARWWDYSHLPCNLQGRICLYGSLIFGGANVALIELVHPLLMNLSGTISPKVLQISAILLFVTILFDCIFTTIHMNDFNIKLKNKESFLSIPNTVAITINNEEDIQDKRDDPNVVNNVGTLMNIDSIKTHFKNSELRILYAFPKFKSTRYSSIVERIKEIIR